jgi:tetratricopeptide (TPR) repeat protein
VKILDFGVAKRLARPADADATASTASQPGTLSGTPAYMAPEVLLEKESDERADIFSLGIVFYEMLTAQHPFRADSFLATSDRILHETPTPLSKLNSRVPERLERIVLKMLAKKAGDRYARAAELLADLQAVGGEAAGPRRFTPQLLRPAYLRVAAVIAAIATLVLLATVPGLQKGIKRRLGFAVVPEQKLLVVLPFSALGGGEEAAAFGKGLIETLNVGLTKLTERHSLQVVPASDVRARGVTTIDQARREFGANLVIEGSLQIAAETDRVTYALVDANTHRQLRADTITAGAANPFAVQDQVLTSVLDALDITLQPRERVVLGAYGTTELAAYNSYLRGRGYLQDYPKPENIESAVEVFNRALERDSQYALAYAGVGEAYWHRYQQTQESNWVAEALGACDRAVALDAGLSNGHVCLGVVYNGTGKYEQAVEQFRRALDLEPTSDDAYRGLASAYESLGRTKEAEETYHRAITLRPQYWAGHSWLGAFYFRQGRYREAADMFEQVVKLAPDSFRGHSNLGAIYFAQGRYAEAIPMFERSVSIRPTAIAYSNLATAYFLLRRFSEAA